MDAGALCLTPGGRPFWSGGGMCVAQLRAPSPNCGCCGFKERVSRLLRKRGFANFRAKNMLRIASTRHTRLRTSATLNQPVLPHHAAAYSWHAVTCFAVYSVWRPPLATAPARPSLPVSPLPLAPCPSSPKVHLLPLSTSPSCHAPGTAQHTRRQICRRYLQRLGLPHVSHIIPAGQNDQELALLLHLDTIGR